MILTQILYFGLNEENEPQNTLLWQAVSIIIGKM